jgi:hypothetical protein
MKVLKLSVYLTAASFILFLLNACEGGTTYSKAIENHSSETLTLEIYSAYGGSESPISIEPNSNKDIWVDYQQGSFAGNDYNCTQEFDSVKVIVSNNKTLATDMMEPNNWYNESSDGRNAKESCTFEVVDQDLE